MPLKNKTTITAFITRKDNNQDGLEIKDIEFLLSQDRLFLQEKYLSIAKNRNSGHKMSTVSDMLKEV